MESKSDLPVIEIAFILGVLFLAIGLIFYFFPPKKINYFYGYRTGSSMESQERWDFSQKYSSIKMIQGSVLLLLISTLSLLLSLSKNQQLIIGIAAVIFHLVGVFYLTEKAINKQFPKA